MRRRELILAAGAAIPFAARPEASLARSHPARPPAATVTGRDSPAPLQGKALLDAYIRMRGDTSGKLSFGWLDAMRYVVIDGEITPFCQVLAGTIATWRELPGERYEATLIEITHYCDPATGELLDTVKMPGTGRTVKVPPYRFGPTKNRFALSLDETEEFEPSQVAGNATAFAPKGRYRIQRDVTDPRISGDMLLIRSNEYGRSFLNGSGTPSIFYREWIVWEAPAAAVLDRSRSSVPCRLFYSALSGFRPWMQMGDVKGHTAENGRGGHVARLEDMPEQYLRLTRRIHPDVIENPEAVLRGPPK
jgi:hypothetical protein